MSRSFYIGESLTEEDVKAKYENGVLTLEFPKEKAIKVPERRTIQIEG
jgi:HSP20 family molecular chaperone IbpA